MGEIGKKQAECVRGRGAHKQQMEGWTEQQGYFKPCEGTGRERVNFGGGGVCVCAKQRLAAWLVGAYSCCGTAVDHCLAATWLSHIRDVSTPQQVLTHVFE